MNASTDRLEFAPPPQPGPVRAFVLAVIAHVLLMLALTWGISWNRESENQAAEAELWSSVPQQAAPKLVEATPTPPPPPAPVPRVEKKVEAPVAPPPPPPVAKEPDIAIEREKKKQQLAKQRQEELEKQKKLEAKLEAKKKLEEEKREQLAEKKEAEERKKKEELAKAAKTQKQQREQDAKLAALRAEQMRRIQGLAGATGAASATGTAQRSAGPSDSYAGRVRARVRPNIVFSDDISGNPTAEVEVRLAPDGTITNRKVVKSSGVKSWDEAVLRALDKTEVLPRDVDGRVPPHLIIEFKPKG
ncbi:cell envelope integrity protein TolA [Ramlibacter sp. WS9]|uniref:cell envelope integrity protein TolA n=1 Tax=Ramlibacter sp. WS9 TaxID=1882741 RepID=UPI0011430216|nr:cell envelope integrity protein TolA [Ramlibacter sp. WS9]ROZ75831.1 cell envelope integrity protein TolA [Ramlibacter sp. WS9]